jgi:hypothetical protein
VGTFLIYVRSIATGTTRVLEQVLLMPSNSKI